MRHSSVLEKISLIYYFFLICININTHVKPVNAQEFQVALPVYFLSYSTLNFSFKSMRNAIECL